MTQSRKLSFEEKIEAVHFCIKNDHNYSLVVEKYQISYQQIYSWTKKYEANGPEVLRDRRGRNKSIEEMTDEEKLRIKLKELEAKNYRLEMENALLKKVRGNRKKGILSKIRNEVAYRAIRELNEEEEYPIQLLCKISKINRSSYYKWHNRKETDQEKENQYLN